MLRRSFADRRRANKGLQCRNLEHTTPFFMCVAPMPLDGQGTSPSGHRRRKSTPRRGCASIHDGKGVGFRITALPVRGDVPTAGPPCTDRSSTAHVEVLFRQFGRKSHRRRNLRRMKASGHRRTQHKLLEARKKKCSSSGDIHVSEEETPRKANVIEVESCNRAATPEDNCSKSDEAAVGNVVNGDTTDDNDIDVDGANSDTTEAGDFRPPTNTVSMSKAPVFAAKAVPNVAKSVPVATTGPGGDADIVAAAYAGLAMAQQHRHNPYPLPQTNMTNVVPSFHVPPSFAPLLAVGGHMGMSTPATAPMLPANPNGFWHGPTQVMPHQGFSVGNIVSLQQTMQPRPLLPGHSRRGASQGERSCICCHTTNTPLWRESLCNACGIRFTKYGLMCDYCHFVPNKQEKQSETCPRCGAPLPPPRKKASAQKQAG